jgi:F-type H+-transporting ATPase subunit b
MLDIELTTILAEIINFLITAVALYFLLFKPTVKRIETRSKEKEEMLSNAKAKEQKAEEKLAKIEDRLASIDKEIESRLEEAYQKAQAESEALLQETQKEAERIIRDAENEAEKRQRLEMEELEQDLVQTILNISSQVLSKTTPEKTHEMLIDELNKEIWDMGKSDMPQVRTIRDSLAERTPTVHVVSAKELPPEQQRALVRTFSALADRNVNMEIEINPELIAGIRIRMGDLVVENNLATELAELRSEVIESLEESVDSQDG